MLKTVKSNYDSLIETVNVTRRGNSIGINFTDLILAKFGIKRPPKDRKISECNLGQMGFFIKCDRTGQTFLAIAKIEDEE